MAKSIPETVRKEIYSEITDNIEIKSDENNKTSADLVRLETENNNLNRTINRLEEETLLLKELFNKANNELASLKSPALLVAKVSSVIEDKAVITISNGNQFYSNVSNTIKNLSPGDSVLVEQKSLSIVNKIDLVGNLEVEKFIIIEKPRENWRDIGGLKREIREIKEVIELPLKNPSLFKKIGIKPPKGILLHGPPGTGKTLLAKAVAHSTNATFIEIVGSELVQKFIGEGAKLVKEIFSLARKKSPTIIFIDEIDALAAMRIETGTSGEREVSRTFMQLLAELDGFKHLDNVKVIGATNRLDILDKAIIRPGRLDRLIEVNFADEEGRLEILKVHTHNMSLKNVKLKELVKNMKNFSGAEIQATCTEAGYFAIREKRNEVLQIDFLNAIKKIRIEEEEKHNSFFG